MTLLVKRLGHVNVHPYYVYVHDLVKGVEDLRTTLQTGAATSRRTCAARRPASTRRRSSSTRPAAAASATRTRTSTTIARPASRVYTAPSVKPGAFYFYFDPIDLLPPEGQAPLGRSGRARQDDRRSARGRPRRPAPCEDRRHERGCTNCGNKGGCDAASTSMFARHRRGAGASLPDAALGRARRGGRRSAPGSGAAEGDALAAALAARLQAATLYRPGGADETCDYVYVLCVGRTPSLVELREAALRRRRGREALRDGASPRGR